MNNKTMYIILAFVLLVALAPQAQAVTALKVTLSKYDPYPATPGQTIRVWLLVQNTANEDAQNINIQLEPQFPFSLYGTDGTKNIDILGANKDYLIDFTLKVDDNAVQGDNTLKVVLTDTTGYKVENNLDIFVQSKDVTLNVDSIKINPKEIAPGSDGAITITVKNNAPTAVTDLSAKLFLQGVVGGTLVDLPFAPVDSGTEKKIYKLDPEQSADFTFNIRTYPDAASKVYKIPITLTYYDSLGTLQNKSDFIGVIINSVPDISLYIDKTDLLLQKKSGTITLKVVNKGLNDIKFLNVIIQKNNDFELLSTSDTTYVGNLVSDDYQTVDYQINIKSDKSNITIPVMLQYRDSNNNYYERTDNVPLNLIDNSKLKDAQSSGSSMIIPIIIGIVIIIGLVIYFRNRSKKSKKGQF